MISAIAECSLQIGDCRMEAAATPPIASLQSAICDRRYFPFSRSKTGTYSRLSAPM